MEFDITKAAHERARYMANISEKYADGGKIPEMLSKKKLSDTLSHKVNELRTLKAWEKLRFVVGYNISGQLVLNPSHIPREWHGTG